MKKTLDQQFVQNGFALAIVLFFSVGMASYFSIQRLVDNQKWVEDTHEVLDTIEQMNSGLQTADRGRQGLIITQDPLYREMYRAGVQKTLSSLQKLDKLMADNPQHQASLKFIEPWVNQKLILLQKSLTLSNQDLTERSRQLSLIREGQILQQQIQAQLTEIKRYEQSILKQRSQELDTTVKSLVVVFAISYVISFCLFLSIYVLLQTQIRDRQVSEEKFRQLAENIQNVFWIYHLKKNKFLYISPAYEKIWGRTYQPLSCSFQFWLEAIHPNDRNRVQSSFLDNIIQGNYDEEYRIVRPDGTIRWIRDRGFPVKNDLGKVYRVTGIAEDISDRKQVELALFERERELKTSENLFRTLSECSPIGIFMIDAGGQCNYINPRCQAIVGFTLAEALSGKWVSFIHPEDRQWVIEKWTESSRLNQPFLAECRYLNKNGVITFGRVQTVPIFSAEGQFIGHVGTIEDITESLAIEQIKKEFISVVSHELRTPLSSIRGSLGLLAAGVLDHKPEAAKKMLEIAANDTERLVRLVNEILDLERLESNKVMLNRQWCDAMTLVNQSVETMRSLAQENQVELEIIAHPMQIWVDPDRIIQTLVNLLSNAIKFSPGGSIVTLSIQELADRVLFKVQDFGRGIPADQLDNIFGRFQQVDASDSRQKGGTGLGLAISRSIVQQHEGKIWVESEIGEGTTFYFTIPLPLD